MHAGNDIHFKTAGCSGGVSSASPQHQAMKANPVSRVPERVKRVVPGPPVEGSSYPALFFILIV